MPGTFNTRLRSNRAPASGALLIEFELKLVHITPVPALAGLKRFHDRVLRGVEMFRGVLVLRRIAATDMTAAFAYPKMHPIIAHFQALFAALRTRRYLMYLIQMRTLFCLLFCHFFALLSVYL